MARGRLAALLGADAADDEAADAVLRQPHVQAAADEGAVPGLVHGERGVEVPQALQRAHMAALQAEGVGAAGIGLHVEDPHDGQAGGLEALDEAVLRSQVGGHLGGLEGGPLGEGLLDVDDEEGGGHGRPRGQVLEALSVPPPGARGHALPDGDRSVQDKPSVCSSSSGE
jgi:hypothetical protein